MRLTSAQVKTIVDCSKAFCGKNLISVNLFGSRTQDDLKGGDIDLVIVVDENAVGLLASEKYALLNNIKKDPAVGDRRIDLHIVSPSKLKQDPFMASISNEFVRLDK